MKEFKNLSGEGVDINWIEQDVIVTKNTVYVHTNVNYDEVGQAVKWYDEIQYTKDEYLQLLNEQTNNANNKIKELENALLNTINAVATLHTEYDKIQYVEA